MTVINGIPAGGGVTAISGLTIDANKDWNGKTISNMAAPATDQSVMLRGLVKEYGSDYGLKWTDLGVKATSTIYAMAYCGNGIVVLGDNGQHVWRSTDYGLTWADLGVKATSMIYAMAYCGNGIVVLGDYSQHVWRSTDYGLTWADLGVNATAGIRAMAYCGNGIVVLGDSSQHVWRSTSAFGNDDYFSPNQFDKTFQFGCLGAITPNVTTYLAPGNGVTQVNEIKVRTTHAGLLNSLFVSQRVASGTAGTTEVYTVRVNGVNTAITCTLNNANLGSDITHSVYVIAGAEISIKVVSNNAVDTSADMTASVEIS